MNGINGIESLWQSAGIPRLCFWVLKRVAGIPCVAACTYCGRRFTSAINPLATVEDLTNDMIEQFDHHDCNETSLAKNALDRLLPRA